MVAEAQVEDKQLVVVVQEAAKEALVEGKSAAAMAETRAVDERVS